jgi:hypothetical protein
MLGGTPEKNRIPNYLLKKRSYGDIRNWVPLTGLWTGGYFTVKIKGAWGRGKPGKGAGHEKWNPANQT